MSEDVAMFGCRCYLKGAEMRMREKKEMKRGLKLSNDYNLQGENWFQRIPVYCYNFVPKTKIFVTLSQRGNLNSHEGNGRDEAKKEVVQQV